MTIHPLIGITLDSEGAGGYSQLPWYALRQNYCDAVTKAGGLPFPLPHEIDLVEDYLEHLDGLLITGGAFDIDPLLFGATARHTTVTLKSRRTDFELAMVTGALARDLPILGICGGEQLLAVALGGELIQHIPDEIPHALAHEQPNPRTEPGHDVILLPDSMLGRLAGIRRIPVNSAHHQAVKDVPDTVVISATADDGVIEAIEDPSHCFCLGVQWHPEYSISPIDAAIFDVFVDASRT